MDANAEIAELKQQMERLHEEVADLRSGGLGGSKTEALMALQYDSLPDFYKSPKAISFYKKFQIIGLLIILLGFAGFAIMIADQIRQDHQNESIFTHHYEIKVDPHP